MRNALRNRPLDSSLILINQEDYKIYGDVVITGQLIVINSKVTITGNLKIVKNENLNNQVFISRSEVSASLINSEADITAESISEKNFIKARYGLSCPNIYGNTNLFSEGTINIIYNSHVGKIMARNYIVGGDNHSKEILSSNSVYISGDSVSTTVHTKRLHIVGDADFCDTTIFIGCFTSTGHVRNCCRNLGFKNSIFA